MCLGKEEGKEARGVGGKRLGEGWSAHTRTAPLGGGGGEGEKAREEPGTHPTMMGQKVVIRAPKPARRAGKLMACLAAVAAAFCSAKDVPSAWLTAATLPHINPRKTFPPATPTILQKKGGGGEGEVREVCVGERVGRVRPPLRGKGPGRERWRVTHVLLINDESMAAKGASTWAEAVMLGCLFRKTLEGGPRVNPAVGAPSLKANT